MNVPFVACIPARDEQALLPKLLASLSVQTSGWRDGRIVIVANNCTDETVSVARRWSEHLPVTILDIAFPTDKAHVGTARKLALDTGCDWLDARQTDGILLTTDADAVVPPDWIEHNLVALQDSDIVGGRLIADFDTVDAHLEHLQRKIERYWEGVRRLEEAIDPQSHDPAPRHGDHTGGSLACRASLYRDLGGLTPIPAGEDTDFVKRALQSGARLRHCPNVSVAVSARAIGRAIGGMAADMARRQAIAAAAGAYLLPHPLFWLDRISARSHLRQTWDVEGDLYGALASEGVVAEVATKIISNSTNAIAFVERASEVLPPDQRTPVDVHKAVLLLDAICARVLEEQRVA